MNDQVGLDDIAEFNRARWEELVDANVLYAQPMLTLTPATARAVVDPHDLLGEIAGRDVLCLASGGGQQSAAFGVLGAHTTVFDLTAGQLAKDRIVADHYGFDLTVEQGDMRDLGRFVDDAFDIVWHAFSINFIPDARPVLAHVARILRPGGFYRLEWANPFVAGVDDREWDGSSYPLRQPYIDGAEIHLTDDHWDVEQADGSVKRVAGPREFRHTVSGIVNTLVGHGFVMLGLWEETTTADAPAPGSWEHYKLVAPPWLETWWTYAPTFFTRTD